MSEQKKEYFNLYVEYDKSDVPYNEVIDKVAYTLLTVEEIYKYIDNVKAKKWGYQPIGSKKLNIVQPHKIQIFDLSIILQEIKEYDFGRLEQVVQLNPDQSKTVLQQLRDFGKDVTATFNINLEEILAGQNGSETKTKETATTAQTSKDSPKENITFDGENITFDGENITTGATQIGKPELKVEFKPIFLTEFQAGILDGLVEPAFNVEKIAKVFASHFKNLKDESGQMVGVFGQWGRGKSYFVDKVFAELKLNTPEPFTKIKFQAWKYQNTPSVWAYLYETFIEEYLSVEWYKKWFRIFSLSTKRNGHWKTWIWPLMLVITGLVTIKFTPAFKDADAFSITLKVAGIAGTLAVTISKISSIVSKIKKPAISIFDSITKVPSFKSALGIQAEIQKELKHLINSWSKYLGEKRILLFVDDLDRCSESQIIEIIDSLRVILDDKDITRYVLILVALDEDKLKRAIRTKYEKLFKEDELQGVVDEYMDKLFISAIKLFPITFDDRVEFVRKLASQINNELYQKNKPESKSNPVIPPTPTPKTEPDKESKTGSETESKPISTPTPAPTPTPTPVEEKIEKNLDEIEIGLLELKIRSAEKYLTPRQIRILIYRYLLARNLWLVFFKELDFHSGEAIDEILRFSGFSKEAANAETKINSKLSEIARMVVAY